MSVLGLEGTARAASTLYAATNLGPFKSTDSGVIWKQLIVTTNDSSLPGVPMIFAIVVDPQTPSTVYAIGRFDSPSGFPLAFLKSTDSGANWSVVSKLTFSYTSGIAALLAIDPVKTNVLYTMAASDGLEVTTDGGVTWSAPTIPKPAGSASGGTPNQPSLQGVAADPNYSGVVYVVGGNASFHPGKGHLFKTSAPRSAARSVKSIPRDLSRPPSGNTGFGGAPWGIAMDTSGNLYVCDNEVGTRVHKVTPGGTRTIIAGNGSNGFSGDGGPATSAQLFEARAVAVDAAGNVYIADTGNLRVRRVDTSGNITTVAGGGNTSPNEVDGGPPTGVNVGALDVAVDSTGNLYIYGGNRVYKVSCLSGGTTPPPAPAISANGVVNGASFQPGVVANSWVTIQGTNLAPQTDDWSHSIVNRALPTSLDGVSVTMGGKPAYVYFISPGQLNVLAPDVPAGPLTVTVTTAGGTSAAFATTATAYGPAFFLWPGNQVVATRQDYSYAAKAGTFAGATTVPAKPGDVIILWATGFGPTMPTAPPGVSVPASGGYSTASAPSGKTEKLMKTVLRLMFAALAVLSAGYAQGVISTVAGNGTLGFSGDGGPATKAGIGIPPAVAVDGAGNLCIVDRNNNRIRKVDTSGTISTFAGKGTSGFSGGWRPGNQRRALSADSHSGRRRWERLHCGWGQQRPPQSGHERHYQLSGSDQPIAVKDQLTGWHDCGLIGERLHLGSEWIEHLPAG
jgi:uncharacterized protein (TIGR03437 family)